MNNYTYRIRVGPFKAHVSSTSGAVAAVLLILMIMFWAATYLAFAAVLMEIFNAIARRTDLKQWGYGLSCLILLLLLFVSSFFNKE